MTKFEQAIKISADSIKQLRGCDVFRVLEWNEVDGLAAWIKKKRPDLASIVDEAVAELTA